MNENLILRRVQRLPWIFIILIVIMASVGFAVLYSASKGNLNPWASRQMIKFCIAIPIMLVVAIVDIRFWFRFSYLAYFFGLGLLILVAVMGVKGGLGSQRWLNLGGFRFQPSEFMKVFLVLALAHYFHNIHVNNLRKITTLIIPACLIGIAAILVLKQPNLGTASIITMTGASVIFISGTGWKKFLLAGIILLAMTPVIWSNMHDYQKERVRTFINPERDPLGAGYNIIQSKIAIGSGGFTGKGFLKGTQTNLSFVPEKQTDFIFSIIAEEFGFIGSILLIILYGLLIISGIWISVRCQNFFGSVMSFGITSILFLHVFINMGMVTGILPVVGVPLPLISYGGSSMISTLIGFGFISNAYVHKDVREL